MTDTAPSLREALEPFAKLMDDWPRFSSAKNNEPFPVANLSLSFRIVERAASALAAHQPADDDVAKLVERLRHPVAEHWLKDAADAADTIDRQRAEIERLTTALSKALAKAERYRWRIARLSNALLTEFTEDDIAVLREVEPDITKRLLNALKGGSKGEEQ